MSRRALLLALLLAACGGRKGGELEPGNRFLYEQGQRDLARAKEDLARGQDPTLDCASVDNAVIGLAREKSSAVQQFRAEGARICGHDAPLAWAGAVVQKMQSAPAGTRFTRECTDLDRALIVLAHPDPNQPDAVELRGKRKALCP